MVRSVARIFVWIHTVTLHQEAITVPETPPLALRASAVIAALTHGSLCDDGLTLVFCAALQASLQPGRQTNQQKKEIIMINVQSAFQAQSEAYSNQIFHGDCIDVLKSLPSGAVDLTITDPPYLVNYQDREGRGILNDVHGDWLRPAFVEVYRVLKADSFCISFYGWNRVDAFMSAWRAAGFVPVGHIVWPKNYSSSSRFLAYKHEQAFLLAKGNPQIQGRPLPDVQRWSYTGNRLHPTQKSVEIIEPLIRSFSGRNDVVLDPFCGSGTTAKAAKNLGRRFIGIEKSREYFEIAHQRLSR
ncbi:MAG: DNA methyltransferase [Verrucomicrobiota bacterium]